MAPRVGIEPTTNGLTVRRSTAELPGKRGGYLSKGANSLVPARGSSRNTRVFICDRSRVGGAAFYGLFEHGSIKPTSCARAPKRIIRYPSHHPIGHLDISRNHRKVTEKSPRLRYGQTSDCERDTSCKPGCNGKPR